MLAQLRSVLSSHKHKDIYHFIHSVDPGDCKQKILEHGTVAMMVFRQFSYQLICLYPEQRAWKTWAAVYSKVQRFFPN